MHASTRFSPFYVVFGREVVLPIDLAWQQVGDCKVEHVVLDVAARHEVYDAVKKHLTAAADAMKRQTDKHRRPVELRVGDHVWLSTTNLRLPAGLTRKLAPKFVGPFKVVA